MSNIKIIDLFCGIGSFHQAAIRHDLECVFACDIDESVRNVYMHNYGIEPKGDITKINNIPDHDILCGGFPCQPFSQIGQRKGVGEDRGRLIDYIVKILGEKKPKAFVLENVKGLLSSNGGSDFEHIITMLDDKEYTTFSKVLRADDYGIPQMRQRLFIVGIRNDLSDCISRFKFKPPLTERVTLAAFMNMPFIKTSAYTIRCGGRHSGIDDRRNWDSYHLEDGTVYTLTIADCMKLQGFEAESWNWGGVSDTKKLTMLGNTIPTCLSMAVLGSLKDVLTSSAQITDLASQLASIHT